MKNNDLYLIAGTRSNPNTALVFTFLFQFINILKAYFKSEVNNKTIKKNFVLIYDILDETLDYGVPQITEPLVLKKYIMEGGIPQS